MRHWIYIVVGRLAKYSEKQSFERNEHCHLTCFGGWNFFFGVVVFHVVFLVRIWFVMGVFSKFGGVFFVVCFERKCNGMSEDSKKV